MKQTILVFLLIFMISWQNLPTARVYKIEIPATQIDAYWLVIHGQGEDLTVKQYKAVIWLLESQIQTQYKQFHDEDSLAALKLKKDSATTKK